MAVAIEVKNVSRVFSGNILVLDKLSFSINKGEKVGVVGPNGSGKTTLLKLLASLLLPSKGSISILGRSTLTEANEVRDLVGWVPAADAVFFPRLNGRENLHVFLSHKLSKNKIDAEIFRWMGQLPLEQALKTPYYLCSTGMRQALNFCRALILESEILLLDEPTRSLDQESVERIVQTINHEFKDKTLIVASHDKDFIDKITGRQIQLLGCTSC